jgi:hypothetical protein
VKTERFALCANEDELWTHDGAGIPGRGKRWDQFGRSLATGNVGAGSPDDLFIGIPGRGVAGDARDAGAVAVIYGSIGSEGLRSIDSQLWTQDSPGVKGRSEPNDSFGGSVS